MEIGALFDVRLDLRMGQDLAIGNDNPVLAARSREPTMDLSANDTVRLRTSKRADIDNLVAHFGKARPVLPAIRARPRAVAFVAGVFANQAGKEPRGDGFEGGDRGGEDADVNFDHGPVHRAADGVRRVR